MSASSLRLLDSMHSLRSYIRRQWGPVRTIMEVVPLEYPLCANVVAVGAYEPGRLATEVFLVTPRGWQRIRRYQRWKRVQDEQDARRALRDAAQKEVTRWL
jgi:hypothetical protein